MKFSDILDLARQGYKPADIKELLSLNTDPVNEPKPEPEPEPKPEPEPEPKPEPEPEPKPEPEPEPDYKKLYEDTLKRLEDLQKSNRRKPIKEHEDTVNDIIREVFY